MQGTESDQKVQFSPSRIWLTELHHSIGCGYNNICSAIFQLQGKVQASPKGSGKEQNGIIRKKKDLWLQMVTKDNNNSRKIYDGNNIKAFAFTQTPSSYAAKYEAHCG